MSPVVGVVRRVMRPFFLGVCTGEGELSGKDFSGVQRISEDTPMAAVAVLSFFRKLRRLIKLLESSLEFIWTALCYVDAKLCKIIGIINQNTWEPLKNTDNFTTPDKIITFAPDLSKPSACTAVFI